MIARLYTRPLGDTVEQDPRGTVGADPIITSGPPSHPAEDEPLPETPVPMIVTVGVPPPGQDISNPPTSGPAETEIVEVPVIAPAPPIAPSQDISSPPMDTSSPAAASSETTTATTPESGSGATLTNPVILLTTTPPATTAASPGDSFAPSGGGTYTPGGATPPPTGSGPGASASSDALLSTDDPFNLSTLTGSLRSGFEKLASAASETPIPLWAWGVALGAGYWLTRKENRRR